MSKISNKVIKCQINRVNYKNLMFRNYKMINKMKKKKVVVEKIIYMKFCLYYKKSLINLEKLLLCNVLMSSL